MLFDKKYKESIKGAEQSYIITLGGHLMKTDTTAPLFKNKKDNKIYDLFTCLTYILDSLYLPIRKYVPETEIVFVRDISLVKTLAELGFKNPNKLVTFMRYIKVAQRSREGTNGKFVWRVATPMTFMGLYTPELVSEHYKNMMQEINQRKRLQSIANDYPVLVDEVQRLNRELSEKKKTI